MRKEGIAPWKASTAVVFPGGRSYGMSIRAVIMNTINQRYSQDCNTDIRKIFKGNSGLVKVTFLFNCLVTGRIQKASLFCKDRQGYPLLLEW